MYRRYYDGYGKTAEIKDRGEIIVPETINSGESQINSEKNQESCGEIAVSSSGCKNSILPFSLEIDDLILIGILLFLIFDKNDCQKDDGNDIFMLLIIGFILFADIF